VTANATASLLMVGVVALYAVKGELTLFVAATAIAGAYLTAGMFSLASLEGWRHWRSAWPSRTVVRDAAAKAIPVLGYTLGMWVLTAGGRWIARMNLTLEDVAQFTVATQVSAVLSLLGRCAYEAWSPVVYSLHSAGDDQAAHEYLARRARICVAFMVVGAAIAMGVVWTFIETHATHYSQVMRLLPIVLAAPIVDMAHLRHYTNLMAAKQVNAIATYTSASIVLFVVAAFLASARFGVYGLCVAFLVTHLFQWALAWAFDQQTRPAGEAMPARVSALR
jgi:O-antigen/teichoic acid export membrane protein